MGTERQRRVPLGSRHQEERVTETRRGRYLIVGCGYIGQRVALRLQAAGQDVVGTYRSERRRREIAEQGVECRHLDIGELRQLDELFEKAWDGVLYAVAPGREGSATAAFRDGPLEVLKRHAETTDRRRRGQRAETVTFVLLSSTGVYGVSDGSWLDEESECQPTSERYEALREGERAVLSGVDGLQGSVLRLGGLYGPGRSPTDWVQDGGFRERLRSRPAGAYMNWIHADDAARAAEAVLLRGRGGRVYSGVDGHPVTREQFFREAARLAGVELGATWPPARSQEQADTGKPRGESEDRGKRLSNTRLLSELAVELEYPDYRAGLAASRAP